MTPDDLISGHLDHTLDDAGHAAFDVWLAADRAHQVRFCQAVLDHQHLLQRGVVAQHATTPSRVHLRLRATPRRWWPLATAAAAALLLTMIGWWVFSTPPDDAPILVRADATEVLRPDGLHLLIGDRLLPGDRLTTGAGAATLSYRDGTQLVLAPGSIATVLPPLRGKRLRLERGELDAQVAKQPRARPMIISTATTEVTVIGTTLSIASTSDEARVSVSAGQVQVTRGNDTVPVNAGSFVVAASGTTLQTHSLNQPIGAVLAVGVGQRYASIADLPALQPGDVVELHAGTHRGGWKLERGGTALRPLIIRGIGSTRPVLDASGQILDGVGATARAVLQLHGSNVVVENLTITGGRNGLNAAGIRCVDARAITIRDCHIFACDQGIDAVADRVEIIDNDIGPCGTAENDGYCHLLHLGGGAATVRGNVLHDATHGQALMSSNRSLVLEANRISGAADGEITLLDPGYDRSVTISGNLLIGRVRERGNHVRAIEIQGTSGGDLHVTYNTLIAAEPSVVFLLNAGSSTRVIAEGNLFAGSKQIAQSDAVLSGLGNQVPADAAIPVHFTNTITAPAADAGFVDTVHGDYRLRADAPGAGRAQTLIIPELQPAAHASPGSLPRLDGNDPGAFPRVR